MTTAIVQAQPAALERYSTTSTASLAPVDDAMGHYRRALGAFQASRNDLRTVELTDVSAALAGEVTTLATLDAVPGRIAARLTGADAARGVALSGRPPSGQRGVGLAPIRPPVPPDGTLLPWPDPRLHELLWERSWRLQDDPVWRALRDGLLGPFVLPSDLLDTPLGRSLRRWWHATPDGGSLGGLGRYGRFAGPLGTVLGVVDLPSNLRTLIRGSGNDGVRGVADRVGAGLSVAATVGGVTVATGAVLMGAASPPGLAIVSVVAVGAGVWALGTTAWDHRELVARYHLGRADRRGRQVERVGDGLQTAGDHLRRISSVVGAGVRLGTDAIGDRFEHNAGVVREAGDDLARLQHDLTDRLEEHAEGHGPIAEHVAERVGEKLEDGARHTTVAGGVTHAVGTAMGNGVRTVGEVTDRTVRRAGRRASEGLQEGGERVSEAGSRIREGIRDVGSWLGLDRTEPEGAGA